MKAVTEVRDASFCGGLGGRGEWL